MEPHPAVFRGCWVVVGTSTGGVTLLEGSLAQAPQPVGSTIQLGSTSQARALVHRPGSCAATPPLCVTRATHACRCSCSSLHTAARLSAPSQGLRANCGRPQAATQGAAAVRGMPLQAELLH